MSKILLPAKVNPWPAFTQRDEGLKPITSNLYDGRLYTFDNVKSSGVPSLFTHPFVFSKKLERDNDGALDEFKQFCTIIKGIFLGTIKIQNIPRANLGILGQVVSGFEAGMKGFTILTWRGMIIGGIYPECLAFPGVRVTQGDFEDIENENRAKERQFGFDTVRGHFRQWVNQVTAPLPGGNLPLWASKLLTMTNAGGVWDSSMIDVAALPALADRSLEIATVDVSDVDDGIPLVRYMDHLLVCQHNGTGVAINLSAHDVSLALGPDNTIICTRLDNKSKVCGHDCNINGIGPVIEEAGFFERRPGEYIIWKDFEEASLPGGCTGVEYFPRNGFAFFTFGNLKIRINGRVLTKSDIFCESVIRFDNGKMPDLPIKSEYLDCVDFINRADGQTTYDIKLKGTGKINHAPQIIDGNKASILLWPSFKDETWKVNYTFFAPSPPLMKQTPSIRLINFNGKDIVSSDIGPNSGTKVDSPVTHVEVLLNGTSVGIFKDTRQLAPAVTEGAISMALDFGTSNTVLAIKDILGGGNIAYRELAIKDKTFDLLNYYLYKDLIFNGALSLPSYTPPGIVALVSNASELIFINKDQKNPANLPQPILQYTVPHPFYNRGDAHDHVVLNFKWEAPAPFNGYERDTRQAYLNMIMNMALAVVRDAPHAKRSVLFTATYPLAFGHDKYEIYKGILCEVINQLQMETGMQITLRSTTDYKGIELIPESNAGKARFVTDGYQLVVDIGGHTTDIALSRGTEVLVVDSINYAGGTYIDFLVENFPPGLDPDKNVSKDIKRILGPDEKRVILNREIRRSGFRDGIFSQYHEGKNIIISKLDAFFNGLFEYIYLLLEAYCIKDDITFYPIGNAWEFTNAIPNIGQVERYIAGWFANKGIVLKVVNPLDYAGKGGSSTRKGSVAIGALQLIDQGGFVHPDLQCPVRSIVGCDVELQWNNSKGRKKIKKSEKVPLNLNIPEDTKPIIITNDFIRSFPWQTKRTGKIDEMIIQHFNAEATARALDTNNREWRLKSSIFSIFLESIFPKYYL